MSRVALAEVSMEKSDALNTSMVARHSSRIDGEGGGRRKVSACRREESLSHVGMLRSSLRHCLGQRLEILLATSVRRRKKRHEKTSRKRASVSSRLTPDSTFLLALSVVSQEPRQLAIPLHLYACVYALEVLHDRR